MRKEGEDPVTIIKLNDKMPPRTSFKTQKLYTQMILIINGLITKMVNNSKESLAIICSNR